MTEPSSWGFLLMHQAIRADLDRMAEVSGAFDATDAATRARFRSWVEHLWMMVEHHHQNEDGTMFPAIRELDPSFDPTELESEHQALYDLFDRVRERLAALDGAGDVAAAQRELAGAVDAVRDHMTEHLDREEEQCVERMDRLFEPTVVQRLEREGARTTPFKIMTRMVPWMLSAASPEDRATVRRKLPFVFRLLNDLFWQRSYDRQAAW